MKLDRKKTTAVLMLACVVLFACFFGRIYFTEKVVITDHQESCTTHEAVTEYRMTYIEDASAPVGVRQEYFWECHAGEHDGASIAFHLVHQAAEVYYNDEMVYSVDAAPGNSLTRSPGSRWVMLPLHCAAHDCNVRIVITPYYEDIAARRTEIYVGSLYSMFLQLLQENLIFVMLSALSLLLGGLMLMSCLIAALTRKRVDATVMHLGATLLLLGVWRITDTKLSQFLFPGNVLALDSITIGTLFLICIPFGLATRSSIRKHMYLFSGFCAMVCLALLVGHVLGAWDIRRLLIVAHGMIALTAVALIAAEMVLLVRKRTREELYSLLLSLLPMMGAMADIISFYVTGSSAGVLYVLVGFLTYAALIYAGSLREARRRMFTDQQTGLQNRARWESLMDETNGLARDCGVMLFDLNRLKQVNDSLGHAAGDRMIRSFASILRGAIPPAWTLCRWGGDEFAVYAVEADSAMLESVVQRVYRAADEHNADAGDLRVEYAVGYASGSEAPHLTPRELFRLADERMYSDKTRRRRRN